MTRQIKQADNSYLKSFSRLEGSNNQVRLTLVDTFKVTEN